MSSRGMGAGRLTAVTDGMRATSCGLIDAAERPISTSIFVMRTCARCRHSQGGPVLRSDQMVEKRDLHIGIEVGGTFTDWVVVRGGQVVRTGKVLSTPGQPEVGVLHA